MFVDSSAWIALVSAQDGRHREAEDAFRAAVSGGVGLWTTTLVVAEVHRFLLMRVGIRPARRALDAMQASTRLRLHFPGSDDHTQALSWLDRLSDQRISYTDAVSFAVMTAARCTAALAFDRDFVLAGFRPWPGTA